MYQALTWENQLLTNMNSNQLGTKLNQIWEINSKSEYISSNFESNVSSRYNWNKIKKQQNYDMQ